jgi:hypothetical protein
MEYQKFDVEFLKKYWEALRNVERHTVERYGDKCPKEVFVRRTFKKWFSGKTIAVIENEGTGWFSDNHSEIKKKVKKYLQIGGLTYYYGYGEELEVYTSNAIEIYKFGSNKIGFNDLLDMEFQEISSSKFNEVVDLFKDDRPDKKFTVKYYDFNKKSNCDIPSFEIVEAKDDREALKNFEIANKKNLKEGEAYKLMASEAVEYVKEN